MSIENHPNPEGLEDQVAFLSDKFGLRLGDDVNDEDEDSAGAASLEEWRFEFGIRALPVAPLLIPRAKAQELMLVIQDWMDQNGYRISGAGGPFPNEDGRSG